MKKYALTKSGNIYEVFDENEIYYFVKGGEVGAILKSEVMQMSDVKEELL